MGAGALLLSHAPGGLMVHALQSSNLNPDPESENLTEM